jgi:Cu/Ag efflux pump CusA
MLALTLSVGILIDDAIIVIENIYRHIEEGMAPRRRRPSPPRRSVSRSWPPRSPSW